jgi:hypothetical protein
LVDTEANVRRLESGRGEDIERRCYSRKQTVYTIWKRNQEGSYCIQRPDVELWKTKNGGEEEEKVGQKQHSSMQGQWSMKGHPSVVRQEAKARQARV